MQAHGERLPWRRLWPLGIPLLLSAVTAAVALWVIRRPSHPWKPCFGSAADAIAGLAAISLAVALVAAAAKGFRWGLHAIVVLTCLDIAVFNVAQHVWKEPPVRLKTMLGSFSPPPPPTSGRLCTPLTCGDSLIMAGYGLMEGYVALSPKGPINPFALRALKAPSGEVMYLVQTASGDIVSYRPFLRIAAVDWVFLPGENARWLPVSDPMARRCLSVRH